MKELFLAVFESLEYREYNSLEQALNACNFVAVKQINYIIPNKVYDTTYHNSATTYEFYTSINGNIVQYVEMNKWRLEYLGNYHYDGRYSKTGVAVRFIDPTGCIKKKQLSTEMEGVIQAIQLLRNYSSENNLRVIELLEENNKLRKELDSLRS